MSRNRVVAVGIALSLFGTWVYAQGRPPKILLSTTRLGPDEYGLQDYTVTTIGSVSFTPRSDDTSQDSGIFSAPYNTGTPDNYGEGFFRYGESGGNASFPSTHFAASVSVPAGAVIDFIGLESYSYSPDMAEVQLYLVDRYDNVTPIAGFQSTQHDSGHDYYDSDYNSSAIGFQLVRNVHNQLVVDVETHAGPTGGGGAFGWVEIWWKRTVSPAPATADFNDVPTTHPFFQFIEALKASGITGGCQASPPLYCPDAPLTRGQMAVFLSKALGLHWPY